MPVLLPLPLAGCYDYAVPDGMAVGPGSFVRVPLGTRAVPAVVWDGHGDTIAATRLRPIEGCYDAPPMPEDLRRLVEWVAEYTLAPPGAVLRMAMASLRALLPEPMRTGYEPAGALRPEELAKLTPARRRVFDMLACSPPLPASVLAAEAACGAAVVRAMATSGLLREVPVANRLPRPRPDHERQFPPFSMDQAEAARAIEAAVVARRFETFLLDGVTGSGKTEVYFKAIARALAAGRQALVLLPEIALGAQFESRFEGQFGCLPAVWHSGLSATERRAVWRDTATGAARVVVGARSALFLPFPELGLIVVDEEHDASYKQEDGIAYHARDMAVVRGSLAQIPVILASATPSLESLVNSERGRYRRVLLRERHGGAALPRIEIVDLRRNAPPRQRFLSPPLVAALSETLSQGEQAMLFLNRRGYAPLTLCRACGHRIECANCSAWLVEHRLLRRLMCHHCGLSMPVPDACPACGAEHSFVACGPGVERLAEEATALFGEARIAVMASDTLDRPGAARDLLARVARQEIDILIGTQTIAKGHHFPMLTLVGVVDADLGLAGGDLRASERTYQLLHQVAGRAGRAEKPGLVLLQTWEPEHPVMAALASGHRDAFLAREAEAREARGLPPFGRLAALILSGADEDEIDAAAAALARAAPHLRGVDIMGPAPAPLALLRGRHRRRFLVKAERRVNIQAVLRQWLGAVRLPGAVRLQVDVDPQSFL